MHHAVGNHLAGVGDEAEAAGQAGSAILHHHAVGDVAKALEIPAQPFGRRLPCEAADKHLSHLELRPRTRGSSAIWIAKRRSNFVGQHGCLRGVGRLSQGERQREILCCRPRLPSCPRRNFIAFWALWCVVEGVGGS